MKLVLAKLVTAMGVFGLLVSAGAQAANPLGLYVGAGGGRADLRLDPGHYTDTCRFTNCTDAAVAGWTAFAGLQPLPFLGAELQYLDFGHTGKAGVDLYSERARALAVFATGTVPLPFVDLYGKVGAGRVNTNVSAVFVGGIECILHRCEERTDRTDTRFGWGLGAQFRLPKLSSLALRAEYVRFGVPYGDPDLLSFVLLWKF
jgi:hypothetical protein